jgi:2,4-dienoyl-CoA reductase-like NADH-dependent reductase (Old Yellow Enzyme family)
MLDPLFRPFALGSLTLKNRFVMSPMTRSFSPGGTPTADVAAYYRRRAEGDCGLIITEGVGIDHPSSIGSSSIDDVDIPLIESEAELAGWRHVVEQVHAVGGKIAPQLWHQGVMREDYSGYRRDVASARPSGLWGPADRKRSPLVTQDLVDRVAVPTAPMSEEDIADVISAYARGARNAAQVGFDAIAIHGAHGYLIDTFLWDETNVRTDRWGGDRKQRSRFAVEVIRAIRREIPADMPVIFRFSQHKQQDFNARLANTPAELEEVLGPIADAGVDVFDASTRRFDLPAELDGSDRTLAGWARTVTGKPSMSVGSVGLGSGLYDSFIEGKSQAAANLECVAALMERGEFDLVAVGRMMLTHADFVRRLKEGQPLEGYDIAVTRGLT